ncbi:Si-specific NAD(P)(+) transhydrogenase [Leptospira sp. GIMC2001]|uniref:Si-specific NAD(P)(+) transhydrogenase n=1 Tax=Leptospira sp. GIMC2001 TaxID=1513297 RepID=UPI00234BA522|nr:Si-specific NAD(P)(+) transhydrogenase [Leptospira sp. GIMC2001]WCL47738.1 Si-specific NAD(P)(+) transhydrogenase [Leptospira sp. GIMC2001]
MNQEKFDVIVIGSGPAGEGAAMKCSKSGKSVAIIEMNKLVGGNCTHMGTIPSKAMRQPIQTMIELKANSLLRQEMQGINLHLPHLLKNAESVISSQVQMRDQNYHRNGIRVIQGRAKILDSHQVSVEIDSTGSKRIFEADHIIIATGSRPYNPPDVDFKHPRILDSDSVLSLPVTPQSLTIYGAGVIGCEYASIFRGLGCKINLINNRDKLLSFLDDEIIDALAYHLREQGVIIRHNEEMESLEPQDDYVILHLKSGKKLKTQYLLWANGRTSNSNGLGLEELGIEVNNRGNIPVNENYQTSVPSIFAVGDVIGAPGLASASYDQGRFAAAFICDGYCNSKLAKNIPTGIYTSPEISSLGLTERELTEQKVPYEVGHAFFKSLARAQITGNNTGMLKLLFHRETFALLGIHCFGYQAAEIIHIGQAIMSQEGKANTIKYFLEATFNYPTMAEAYRVAALNGVNRVY